MPAKPPPTAKLTFYPTIKPRNERGNAKSKPLNPNLAIIVSTKPLSSPVAAAFEHGEESQCHHQALQRLLRASEMEKQRGGS
jgi:hypothetical protein